MKPDATVVLNLLVGMTGTGSSGGPQEIEAMVSAIHKGLQIEEVFTIRTPINESSGNQIYGFLKKGRKERHAALKEDLKTSAQLVNQDFPPDSMLGIKLFRRRKWKTEAGRDDSLRLRAEGGLWLSRLASEVLSHGVFRCFAASGSANDLAF